FVVFRSRWRAGPGGSTVSAPPACRTARDGCKPHDARRTQESSPRTTGPLFRHRYIAFGRIRDKGFAPAREDGGMDPDAGFDAQLEEAGVTFTDRDAALLEAVDTYASISGAAEALGRSYSRSQQRVVELEGAFGPLVDRRRGGDGGGGSTLTTAARRLLREFDRLRVEFTGVAEAEETVLEGRIVERDGELATIDTDAGSIRTVVPAGASGVRVSIRADAVTLHSPGTDPATETSARNRFSGTVVDIETG